MRRFVVIGRHASASADFLLDDLAGTSGRLDVLVRCVRAALLVSHGVRHDAVVYLVLGGGANAPRTLRIEGAAARFLRPDERSLAILIQKSLVAAPAAASDDARDGTFVPVRPGIAVAAGGVERAVDDLGAAKLVLLEPSGTDIRLLPELGEPDVAFFVGDPTGFDEGTRARLVAMGARSASVGPVGLHAEDAVAVASNEIDRRAAARG